jgi:acetyl-CoA carboxylase carboxyltransferase component
VSSLRSPMPGMVVAVHAAAGQVIEPGDRLVTVEAMKCETAVVATDAGRVEQIATVGQVIAAGDGIAEIAPLAVRVRPPTPQQAVDTALAGWGSRASFTELDLDTNDCLGPVGRPLGEQSAGIVVGTMSHWFPGHRGPTERVWLAGDPTRQLGALSEPECRRILAAVDRAEVLGVPLEWVAVSSGALISMDSGTENMDWCAAVMRRLLTFTAAGGEVIVIVAGVNVGAQSYFNSAATMLSHCAGLLVQVTGAAMVLTGHRALAVSGGVSASDDLQLGGYDTVMGPNGQAHHCADNLAQAYGIVLDHLRLTRAEQLPTSDPIDRDVCLSGCGTGTVGDVLDASRNPTRKLAFQIRPVMAALVDQDGPRLERWRDMHGADGAVVWEAAIGGIPTSVIGIESHPRPNHGGEPQWWLGATLYPAAAKKITRALVHASGRRPVVVLANLAGFDGSAWSLRHGQLEAGASIARAVVDFDGPIVVVIIGRFHGGAYVVFNKQLNPRLQMIALEETRVSVIGGSAAASVVFAREVQARAADSSHPDAEQRIRSEMAAAFDTVHCVDRARALGSVDAVIEPARLRPVVCRLLGRPDPQPRIPDQPTTSALT